MADEWLWAFGDGMTSTLASPVYTYTQAGVYTVTQWVTDTATGEWDVLTRTDYITVALGLVTTTIAYDYDPLYRLITATYSSGEVYTYTYDDVGNVTWISDKRGAQYQYQDFAYDSLDRLTSAATSGAGTWGAYSESYAYNAIGNLTNKGGVSYTYPLPGQARPHAVTGTSAGDSYTYDANGNMTARIEDGETYVQA